jgi:hypothetical protein
MMPDFTQTYAHDRPNHGPLRPPRLAHVAFHRGVSEHVLAMDGYEFH